MVPNAFIYAPHTWNTSSNIECNLSLSYYYRTPWKGGRYSFWLCLCIYVSIYVSVYLSICLFARYLKNGSSDFYLLFHTNYILVDLKMINFWTRSDSRWPPHRADPIKYKNGHRVMLQWNENNCEDCYTICLSFKSKSNL